MMSTLSTVASFVNRLIVVGISLLSSYRSSSTGRRLPYSGTYIPPFFFTSCNQRLIRGISWEAGWGAIGPVRAIDWPITILVLAAAAEAGAGVDTNSTNARKQQSSTLFFIFSPPFFGCKAPSFPFYPHVTNRLYQTFLLVFPLLVFACLALCTFSGFLVFPPLAFRAFSFFLSSVVALSSTTDVLPFITTP